jgi:hypothetical protein
MPSPIAIFLDFNLPNATTWLYFSFLLAMALFFKFSRLLSVRNLDIVMVFLLVPGLLVQQASRPQPMPIEQEPVVQVASLFGHGAMPETPAAMAGYVANFTQRCGAALEKHSWLWVGYLWLLLGSVYFFCRCLLDLTLVQRPALGPNLQTGGLAWLAGALLICLLAVAYRQVESDINLLPTSPSALSPGGRVQNEGAGAILPPSQTHTHPFFAVAILWREWPTWAVAALAFGCHIAVVVALVLISWRHFQDRASGMAAVTFYLLLPYTGLYVGQLTHILPMALFMGTLLAYRRPTLAGCILGIATATTYFPLFVLPIWLSFYRGRGAGRFITAFLLAVALVLLCIAVTLHLADELQQTISNFVDSPAWQPWKDLSGEKTPPEGFWTGVPAAYRIPVFLLYLSFVFGTRFWPAPKNLAHVIALCAAVFIGLQWWWADRGGVYVLWYLPLLLLLTFRPFLQDRVAPPITADTDWLTRSLRWCLHSGRRIIHWGEPAQKNRV